MGLQVWSGLHVMVPLPFTWWPFGHVMLTDCPTWNILWETFLLVFSLQTGGGGQGKAARNNKISFFLIIIILSILTLKTNFRQPQEQSWHFVVIGNKILSVVFAVCVRACVFLFVSSVSRWQEGKVELQVFPPIHTASGSPARRYPLLHWNRTAWPVFRLSSCTLPFCISLGLWQPLAAGSREQIARRWRILEVPVNVGARRGRFTYVHM